ncbi:MAG: tetratricopeptide repeat protein [Sphingomicrobium sp.]
MLAIVCGCPAVLEAAPQGMRSITTDAGGLLAYGHRLEEAGKKGQAARLYETLTRDPDANIRSEARFRLAKFAIERKAWSEAALLLRRLVDERPDASAARLVLAQVLVEIGDEASARRELRAAQAGNLPREVARQVDRFSEALRVRKPFGASLELALAPDSNINAASSSDTLGTVIGDFVIDEGSRKTSGTGLALRGHVFARRAIGSVPLLARATATADLYSRKRFNRINLDLAVGPEFKVGKTNVSVEAGALVQWIGMQPYQDVLRVGVEARQPIGRTTYGRAGFTIGRVNNRFNNLQDGRTVSANVGVEQALGHRTGLGVLLSGDRDRLDDPGYSNRSWRTQAFAWQEIGRTTVTMMGGVGGLKADERLSIFPDRRKEKYRSFALSAQFRQLTAHALAPYVRLSWENNSSSVEIYDFTRRRVEFGVSRAF